MNLIDLILRVRALTRDFSNSVFREQDIINFINSGINRCRQVIPELAGMKHLVEKSDVVTLLPSQYHDLLIVFSTSRCFMQDESFYQATTYMNEFEQKLDELLSKIENGEVVIVNPDGTIVERNYDVDYVKDDYFYK